MIRSCRVILVVRADVTGEFLKDGPGLAAGIANQAIGLPDGGWSPPREPTTFSAEAYGKQWAVEVREALCVARYPVPASGRESWDPTWTSEP